MDQTDRQFVEQMIRMHTANLLVLQATPDSEYADIVYCLGRIAYYSRRLFDGTFGQISGASR